MTGSNRKALGSWSMLLLQFEEELFTFPHASARAAVAPMLHKQRCCLYQMVFVPTQFSDKGNSLYGTQLLVLLQHA